MILKSSQVEAFLKAPPAEAEIVVLYGRDAGLVRERSKLLEAVALGKGADPFRLVELAEAALKEEPGALYAEAAAISMLGGRKFIRVRTAPEPAATALEAYIALREAGSPKPDALIAVEAGDLKKTHKLLKLAESSPFIAAIACYPDSEEALELLVDRQMKEAGARISPEARELLIERLGGDRGVSRQEIDKLLLYAGAGPGKATEIRIEDVQAMIGDSAAADLDQLIDAVLSGNLDETSRLTQRLRHSAAPVRVLRALSVRLDWMSSPGFSGGRGFGGPPWRGSSNNSARWPERLTARARSLVLEAEISCKTTGLPAEAILERTLLTLARGARDAPPS